VRAWDTVVREAVPGFPDYAQAQVVSTFAFSGAVPGVGTLVGSQPSTPPFVRLTWTRTGTPDVFVIFVDGIKVMTLPGTTLTYDLWAGFTLGTQHLFEVMAGVGTPPLLSASNIDALVTPKAFGAWFWRETDNVSVQLLNESAAYAIDDDMTFLQPVSESYPVAIFGDAHAAVLDVSGVTRSKTDRDIIEDMVRTGEPVRLLTGDLNALVQLNNLAIDPGPATSWDVRVTATQVGA
jgi:hypothetical protein